MFCLPPLVVAWERSWRPRRFLVRPNSGISTVSAAARPMPTQLALAGLPVPRGGRARLTSRAALTYLHANDERQRAIAETLSKLSARELKRRGPGQSGTHQARKHGKAS